MPQPPKDPGGMYPLDCKSFKTSLKARHSVVLFVDPTAMYLVLTKVFWSAVNEGKVTSHRHASWLILVVAVLQTTLFSCKKDERWVKRTLYPALIVPWGWFSLQPIRTTHISHIKKAHHCTHGRHKNPSSKAPHRVIINKSPNSVLLIHRVFFSG
jgi:hypothetical protein